MIWINYDYFNNYIINYRSCSFRLVDLLIFRNQKKNQNKIIDLEHQILQVENSIMELEKNS